MGKISQGILGGISGKVGNVIGGTWKGIDYLRVKPSSVANPRTEGQVNQRNKFTAVLEFLQPNLDFLKVGFKNSAIKQTEFNAAMSYNLRNAITGSAPNFSVDYANTLLSKGNLSKPQEPAAVYITAGHVDFSWRENTGEGDAKEEDLMMMLVYNPSKKESVSVLKGIVRGEEEFSVSVPSSFVGDVVHSYIAIINQEGTITSDSVYLGSGTVA